MKLWITLFTTLILLCGCVPWQEGETTSEREAYRACIHRADGSAGDVRQCQQLLAPLDQQPQHRQFARHETVRVLDYQRCLDAEQMGGGEGVRDRCGQLWQEIKRANQ